MTLDTSTHMNLFQTCYELLTNNQVFNHMTVEAVVNNLYDSRVMNVDRIFIICVIYKFMTITNTFALGYRNFSSDDGTKLPEI